MKITLDSKGMDMDSLSRFGVLIEDLSLSDLLVINKMVVEETNRRVDIMDKRVSMYER